MNNNKNKRKDKRKEQQNYQLANQNSYTSVQKRWLTGFDPHMYATLRYVENISVSVATTVGTQQTMNINSLFDPNRTGVGHQPYLFDTFSTLYNRYRVLKTRWKVTFGNTTGTYNVVVLPLNGLLTASVTNSATYETACEQPRSIFKIVPGSGGYPVTIASGTSLNSLNGCTKEEYLADDRFEAQIGASPTEIMTLNIGVYNPTLATILVNFTVEMFFSVDFHDLISLAGS